MGPADAHVSALVAHCLLSYYALPMQKLSAIYHHVPTQILPSYPWQVWVMTESSDGLTLGAPVALTPTPLVLPSDSSAPVLAAGAAIDPASVGATGFSVAGVSLDRQGFVYVMVTRLSNQALSAQVGLAAHELVIGKCYPHWQRTAWMEQCSTL